GGDTFSHRRRPRSSTGQRRGDVGGELRVHATGIDAPQRDRLRDRIDSASHHGALRREARRVGVDPVDRGRGMVPPCHALLVTLTLEFVRRSLTTTLRLPTLASPILHGHLMLVASGAKCPTLYETLVTERRKRYGRFTARLFQVRL